MSAKKLTHVENLTPDEIPQLTIEALAIGTVFRETVGEIPTTWAAVLTKIPQIVKFFVRAAPHLKTIIAEIKD